MRASLRATRTPGLVVSYDSLAGSLQDFVPIELGEAGSLLLTRPHLDDYLVERSDVQRRTDAVFSALVARSLRVSVSGEFTLSTLAQALDGLESSRQVGKSVVRIFAE